MEVGHQRAIVEALEAGRQAEALAVVEQRYELYLKGQPLNTFAHMTDDGKTAGGWWIYTGVTVEGADG